MHLQFLLFCLSNGDEIAMDDDPKYHWSEGTKFAQEGIKTLFLLNGAATISILSYIGNSRLDPGKLSYTLLCYGFGAATGPIAFWCAYLTSLHYGLNAMEGEDSPHFQRARKFQAATQIAAGLGLSLFVIGTLCAVASLGYGWQR
jgi:hypothetical protein